LVIIFVWKFPKIVALLFAIFLVPDLTFLGAIVRKIPNGGFVSIIIAVILFLPMLIWLIGEYWLRIWLKNPNLSSSLNSISKRIVYSKDQNTVCKYTPSINNIHEIDVTTVPTMGIFITNSSAHTPHHFENFISNFHAFPQVLIFLNIKILKVPKIMPDNRLKIKVLDTNIYLVNASYGYTDRKENILDDIKSKIAKGELPSIETQKIAFITAHPRIRIHKTFTWNPRTWNLKTPLYFLLLPYQTMKGIWPTSTISIKLPVEQTIAVATFCPLLGGKVF